MGARAADRLPVRGIHLHGLSAASVLLCIALWFRAKAIGEDERGNAERRAIFVGLWPPMLWLLGDSLSRREEATARGGRLLAWTRPGPRASR